MGGKKKAGGKGKAKKGGTSTIYLKFYDILN